MEFKDRLLQLRKEKNMSREELAKKLNLSYSAISKYETGARTPDDDIKKKIAEYFNVSLDYLMGVSDIRYPYKEEDEKLSDLDKFLLELKKKAIERGIEFNEDSVDDLLDLYEFIKSRNKKSN
ncbi:helix-turn-helix domain-containing protein [Tepidimicrobium xylanilyticum]|uniref:Helix-turn-helix n=1 Tax=Tepidimicrobium xylanilyticum TaxID=1123352 RepID=A0A1H2YK82_9FIRM|nr:helix-turn-helix transcriptional regulator [Tepidimicrobium xylanilyticum]SDX05623.1 Helix-turn-helix [Tepidimicrobium xylanilyticum]